MLNEEEFKLLISLTGEDDIKRLKDEYAELKKELYEYEAAQSFANDAAARADAKYAQLSRAIIERSRMIRDAERGFESFKRKTGDLDLNVGSLAFAGLNIGQDVMQGGPAAAINNVIALGPQLSEMAMKWDQTKAAIGEATKKVAAAAPSWSRLSSLIAQGATKVAPWAVAATAAGAATKALGDDLRDAGLGWGDLGTVLGNTSHVLAAAGAMDTLGEAAQEAGDTVKRSLGDGVLGGVAQAAGQASQGVYQLAASLAAQGIGALIGWDEATEAARAHNKEVAETEASLKRLADASEKYRSAEQKAQDTRRDLLSQALADMGGAGGLGGLADKLGVGPGVDERAEFDKLLAKARDGDISALGEIGAMAQAKGIDTGPLRQALAGTSAQAEMEKALKAQQDANRLADARLEVERTIDQARLEALDKAADKTRDLLGLDERRKEVNALIDQGRLEALDEAARKNRIDRDIGEARAENQQLFEGIAKEARDKALKQAERATAGTGLDARLGRAALIGMATGRGTGPAIAGLSAELQRRGMGGEDARTAATEMVTRAFTELGDRVTEQAMRGAAAPGPAQMFQGADALRAFVQTGADPMQQSLRVQERMLENLVAIRREQMNGVGFN